MSNRIALCDVSGPLIDLLQKLSGENVDEWQRGLAKFLRKENPWEVMPFPASKIWKTIKLGTGLKTADDFSRAFNENGCKIGGWAKDILGKAGLTVASEETEVDLVVVSVAELGFKEGAIRKDIYERAQGLGLALCPTEVGPQLRLQYKDHPQGGCLFIAMEPILNSCGNPSVFYIVHADGDLWLYGYHGDSDGCWNADDRWVFLRRK